MIDTYEIAYLKQDGYLYRQRIKARHIITAIGLFYESVGHHKIITVKCFENHTPGKDKPVPKKPIGSIS